MINTKIGQIKKQKIIRPNKIKVIRKKEIYSWWSLTKEHDKYFSSTLQGKQYIYSFNSFQTAEKCKKFINDYKQVNGVYPDASSNNAPTIIEFFEIDIEDEIFDLMKERCLINGVGLLFITDLEYTFDTIEEDNTSDDPPFNLKIYGMDLLKNEEIENERIIDNLNYLLDF